MTEPQYVNTSGLKVLSDDLKLVPISKPYDKVINTIGSNLYGLTAKDTIFKGL